MELSLILGVAAVLFAIGLGLWLVVARGRLAESRREAFDRIGERLSQELPLRQITPSRLEGTGDVGGRPWMLEVTRGSREHPTFLRVRLELHPYTGPGREARRDARGRAVLGPIGARFRPRRWWDRIGKALQLERRVPSGDGAFDAAVCVETTASNEAAALLLGEEAVRRGVLELVRAGAHRVELLSGAPSIVAVFRDPTMAQAAGAFDAACELLRIAEVIPVVGGEPVERARGLGAAWVPIGWSAIALGGVGVGLVLSGPHPIVEPGALSSMIGAGLALWLPACLLSYVALFRRTRGVFAFVFAVPAALFAAVLGAIGSGHASNALFDEGPAKPHDVRVISVSTGTYRGGYKTHSITVASWRVGGAPFSVDVPGTDLSRYVSSGRARVFSRPGRLGWEWASSVEPLAGARDDSDVPVPPSAAPVRPPDDSDIAVPAGAAPVRRFSD